MFDYYNSYDLVNMSDGRRPVKNHIGEQGGDGLGSIFASIFGKITKAGVSSAVKATAKQAVKTAVDTAKRELPGAIKKGAESLGKTAVEEGAKFAVSTIEDKIKRKTKKADEEGGTALNKPTRELSNEERKLQRARIQDIIKQERLRLQRDKAEDEEYLERCRYCYSKAHPVECCPYVLSDFEPEEREPIEQQIFNLFMLNNKRAMTIRKIMELTKGQ